MMISSACSSSRVPPSLTSCPLYMECDEEPLSMVQLYASRKKLDALSKQLSYLEKLAQTADSVVYSEEGVVLRVPESHAGPSFPTCAAPSVSHPPGYRLIMDPRTGRILGTIDSSGGRNLQQDSGGHPRLSSSSSQSQMASHPPPPPLLNARQLPPPPLRSNPHRPPLGNTPPLQQPPPPLRSKSHTRSPSLVDLTRANNTHNTPGNSSEKSSKSIIPTLLVVPKASKALPSFQAHNKRSELDAQVKSLLIHTPSKFTEWLIQQGLIPAEQWDTDVATNARVKLKLGMYSDGKKFPSSGGYVWIHEKKANKCISVYTGSIFMATNHAPTVILKLMYHWSCQTNVSNVVQWVKVEQNVVNLYYKLFRSVCTIAVHEAVVGLGGLNKTVEIGVISLGTTSLDSAKREVKVEVLGILDVDRGMIRLRASEPAVGVTQAERFARIFEPLPNWVHKNSWIITDLSVDEEQLTRLGYKNIRQCSVNAKRSESNNATVMDFLKRTVPKMFQNNLSYLSISEIQQFLDELTFREINHYPLASFEALIAQLSKITGGPRNGSIDLVGYLQKVQDNPFFNWHPNTSSSSSNTLIESKPSGSFAKKRSSSVVPDDIDALISKRSKVSSELVDLESYFYGSLPGDMKVLTEEFKADMAFKCHLCREVYMNNLDFMKHLFLHLEKQDNSPVDWGELIQRKYCIKDLDDHANALESLINTQNLNKTKFICRICKESFRLKNHLIHHMTKTHVRSELPYLCFLCGFRSSSHLEVLDHFYEAHDRTDKIQCPRCLKIYSLMSERGYNADIASAFLSHLQFHEKRKGFSCKSCSLSFLQNDSLRNHVIRDHASYKDFETLEVYKYGGNEEPIVMPRPDERLARPAAKKMSLPKAQVQTAFAAQNLEDLVMYNVDKEECGECSKRITNAGHFAAYLCCTKCRYSTCCSKAISVHFNLFHWSPKPVYTLGEPCILDAEIYCVCGFSTFSGNKMAKHLGTHGCKSAYPNKETAIKAIKTSISEEEATTTMTPYCMPVEGSLKTRIRIPPSVEKGPLAFLGLQRNPHNSEDDDEDDDNEEEEQVQEAEPAPPPPAEATPSALTNEEQKEKEPLPSHVEAPEREVREGTPTSSSLPVATQDDELS